MATQENIQAKKREILGFDPPPYFVAPDADYPDQYVVIVASEPFEGVKVRYGSVSFGEKPNSDGTLDMQYNFNVLYDPDERPIDELEADPSLRKILGDIAMDLLCIQILKTTGEA